MMITRFCIYTFCIRSKQMLLTLSLQKRSHNSVFSTDQVNSLDTSYKRQNVSNL